MKHSTAFGNAYDLEEAFGQLISEGYRSADSGSRSLYNFESQDGRTIIELKVSTMGARDLRANLLQLAIALHERPEVTRAILVTRLGNMSADRVKDELRRLEEILRVDLARRLRVVAVTDDRTVLLPHADQELSILERAAQDVLARRSSKKTSSPWTPKAFQIWLMLLDAWLRNEPPLPVGLLGSGTGCSYPTVNATLERLSEYGEVTRSSNRRAAFKKFPKRSLNEILVLADSLRPTTRYVDASGRPADTTRLVRRLLAVAPKSVALGGVTSARHYSTDFDLNGTPRIDLSVNGSGSFDWLEQVDPALRPVDPADHRDGAPILVIHSFDRKEPRFDPAPDAGLPFAGPAETLLDLYDLRLTVQAEEFVRAMRGKMS